MGLTEGVALVTPAQVGEITHEATLQNLDDDASATVANAAKWATSWLIDELDSRGIDCSLISNPERLVRAAAFYVAARSLEATGGPDDAVIKRAGDYLAEARDLVAKYRFVSSAVDDSAKTNLGLPSVGNMDACSAFPPLDHRDFRPGWGPA